MRKCSSNLTNKYNPQEQSPVESWFTQCSNLTNKYNPQEHTLEIQPCKDRSNLTNKYNPQELILNVLSVQMVQILPINTILKNPDGHQTEPAMVQILPINTILKNIHEYISIAIMFKSYQ